jgi:hypothetical protein
MTLGEVHAYGSFTIDATNLIPFMLLDPTIFNPNLMWGH